LATDTTVGLELNPSGNFHHHPPPFMAGTPTDGCPAEFRRRVQRNCLAAVGLLLKI
jgi:hypothetical protein